MKHLKMLGLAAIAALGLLAFVGAGTASATTLFKDAAKTEAYGAGTEIKSTLAPGTSALLKSGSVTIATCTESSAAGTTANATGITVSIDIHIRVTGGCSQTTHTTALGSLSINSEGDVTGKGNSVTLGVFGTSCTYGTGEGGSPAVLKINAQIPRIAGGFLCPSPGTWTAEYIVTSPSSLYVGA
jgi:hypothetical protein